MPAAALIAGALSDVLTHSAAARPGNPLIRLLHPIGALLAERSSTASVEVSRLANMSPPSRRPEFLQTRWRTKAGGYLESGATHQRLSEDGGTGIRCFQLRLVAPQAEGEYALEVCLADSEGVPCGDNGGRLEVPVLVLACSARARMAHGIEPLSYAWGTDRGLPVHRFYLETFLERYRLDFRGACLEFQEPLYGPRFGGERIARLDILHVDESNPAATLVGDLTRPNSLPSEAFDCIVCTHVLHLIYEVEKAARSLYRLLKPGGVLLAAVPHTSMQDPRYGELWRFTPEGLRRVLASAFGAHAVTVHAYGNSLTAAGDLRGLVASEFSGEELNAHDARFALEVCARAVRPA